MDFAIFLGEGGKAIHLKQAMACSQLDLGKLLGDGIGQANERLGPAYFSSLHSSKVCEHRFT